MKQVSKEGRLLDSATPSPKESPIRVGMQNPQPEMGGVLQSNQSIFSGCEGLKNLPMVVQGTCCMIVICVRFCLCMCDYASLSIFVCIFICAYVHIHMYMCFILVKD